MKIKIVNKSINHTPSHATTGSAGMDLRANIPKPVTIKPMQRKLIYTGLFIELPLGYEAQLRPRSGLALKKGVSIPNTPATIDSDYRGEIGVILINLSDEPVIIEPSERIAQMVICKHEIVEWEEVGELTKTNRGAGGFGSTGKK